MRAVVVCAVLAAGLGAPARSVGAVTTAPQFTGGVSLLVEGHIAQPAKRARLLAAYEHAFTAGGTVPAQPREA